MYNINEAYIPNNNENDSSIKKSRIILDLRAYSYKLSYFTGDFIQRWNEYGGHYTHNWKLKQDSRTVDIQTCERLKRMYLPWELCTYRGFMVFLNAEKTSNNSRFKEIQPWKVSKPYSDNE